MVPPLGLQVQQPVDERESSSEPQVTPTMDKTPTLHKRWPGRILAGFPDFFPIDELQSAKEGGVHAYDMLQLYF